MRFFIAIADEHGCDLIGPESRGYVEHWLMEYTLGRGCMDDVKAIMVAHREDNGSNTTYDVSAAWINKAKGEQKPIQIPDWIWSGIQKPEWEQENDTTHASQGL